MEEYLEDQFHCLSITVALQHLLKETLFDKSVPQLGPLIGVYFAQIDFDNGCVSLLRLFFLALFASSPAAFSGFFFERFDELGEFWSLEKCHLVSFVIFDILQDEGEEEAFNKQFTGRLGLLISGHWVLT